MPRYELGDEFWDITQDGMQLAVVSGNAHASKATVRVFGSALQAHAALVTLTEEKLAAGYQLVDDATLRAARLAKLAPRPPEILVEQQRPELEAAIIANPYDTASYAVYGDWLQSRGEPRGELIALQLAEEADPTTERAGATRDYLATHPTLTRGLKYELGAGLRHELLADRAERSSERHDRVDNRVARRRIARARSRRSTTDTARSASSARSAVAGAAVRKLPAREASTRASAGL